MEDEILSYVDIKLQSCGNTVTLKNIDLDMLSKFSDNNSVIDIVCKFEWYMYGVYDIVEIHGYKFIIVSKTKTKVDLVKNN